MEKTLIVYGTKHGTAAKCANILKDKLQGEVKIINIKEDIIPDITNFDTIIIGGSIYAGQIQKEIKKICIDKLTELKNKRIGLFICGMNDNNFSAQLKNFFPEELIAIAIAKEYFGGEVVFEKMNFLEKFIMKKVAKTNEDISKISEDNICKCAELMNKAK